MVNFKCILCIFKIQNTVFVYKYIFPHCILYLNKKNSTQYFVFKYIFPHSILYFYFKYMLMYLCPSLVVGDMLQPFHQQITLTEAFQPEIDA